MGAVVIIDYRHEKILRAGAHIRIHASSRSFIDYHNSIIIVGSFNMLYVKYLRTPFGTDYKGFGTNCKGSGTDYKGPGTDYKGSGTDCKGSTRTPTILTNRLLEYFMLIINVLNNTIKDSFFPFGTNYKGCFSFETYVLIILYFAIFL